MPSHAENLSFRTRDGHSRSSANDLRMVGRAEYGKKNATLPVDGEFSTVSGLGEMQCDTKKAFH
jgi:hypothetical protein